MNTAEHFPMPTAPRGKTERQESQWYPRVAELSGVIPHGNPSAVPLFTEQRFTSSRNGRGMLQTWQLPHSLRQSYPFYQLTQIDLRALVLLKSSVVHDPFYIA